MILDLSDDETRALARHLRHALDFDPYPHAPRLDTLKAILEKLEPAPARPEPLPPLRPGMAPTHGAGEAEAGSAMTIDLGTIITALHDSEINGAVSWVYDDIWTVQLGDAVNGIAAEAVVGQRAGGGRMAARERGQTVSAQRVRAAVSSVVGHPSLSAYRGPRCNRKGAGSINSPELGNWRKSRRWATPPRRRYG
jgi:hypothetical protein